MTTFFTSDTHFNHTNIITYSNRPFKNVDEMNKELIRRWNERVKAEDIVYFLGDFCFYGNPAKGNGLKIKPEEYIKQLNGNIIFIKGNHDDVLKTDIHSLIIKKANQYFYLIHDPGDGEPGMINICGHVHEAWKFQTLRGIDFINVGVDQWGFYPITFNELYNEYTKWKNEQERN